MPILRTMTLSQHLHWPSCHHDGVLQPESCCWLAARGQAWVQNHALVLYVLC